MVTVVIVGSRRWADPEDIFRLMDAMPPGTEFVSGGQPKGVDGWVKAHALARGLKYNEVPPDHYSENKHCLHTCPLTGERIIYGRVYQVQFYHIRNERMVVYAQQRGGFAFIFNCKDSKGADSFIGFAKKHRLSHHIFRDDGTEFSCYYFKASSIMGSPGNLVSPESIFITKA